MGRARIGSWELVVDDELPEPPYAQIVNRMAAAIGARDLADGLKLPSVRALATELGLAVNTVAKAYRQLEAEGAVETRGRNGTVVRGRDIRDDISLEAARLVQVARRRDLDLDETLGVVRRAWSHRD